MEAHSKKPTNPKPSPVPSLQRHIGLFALTFYGVGDILGAGIYGLIGKAADQMGNAIWLAFLVSMLAAGLTGLSYASLGSRYPRAGGASYVVHRAFRKEWIAYGVGLATLASGLTSMATATRVFAGYLQALTGISSLTLLMIAFALALGFVVFWGIRESMWVNTTCTFVEVAGLLFVIAIGVSYIGSINPLDATTAMNPQGEITPGLVLSGAVLSFYSFIGFEDMLNVSEEVIKPERNLPIGLLSAVAIASVIYMSVGLIAVSVVPASELAGSQEPLVEVVRRAAPWFPTSIYSVVALFAVANTALLNFIMGSRLVYGMAGQGLLPSVLAKVHPKRRTPHISIAILLLIFLFLSFLGDISSLAKATSMLLLISFLIVNLALLTLQSRKDEARGGFEIPRIIPIAGALVCAALLANARGSEILFAGGILCVIAVLYLILRPSSEAIDRIDQS